MNINAINHSKNKANAKLVWDNNKLMAHPEWLQQPPQQWIDTQHAGLVLSVEATRDIHPNEEILLNYGTEWQGTIRSDDFSLADVFVVLHQINAANVIC